MRRILTPILISLAVLLAVAFTAPHLGAGDSPRLFEHRVQRTILGCIVGGSLAMAGAVFQALLRNPLATPFTLGVAGGSAFGAIVALRLGIGGTFLFLSATSAASFAGALVSGALVVLLARDRRGESTVTLILAGVAVNFFFSALNLALQYTADPYATRNILLWLMGDLSQANAARISQSLPFCIAGALLALLSMRDMNALVLGEETAASLGVEVWALRRNLFLAASTLTAGAIAAAGPITFVGLVVPHTIRLLFGPDHRILVPCSGLLGGAFLVLCDLPCRLEKTFLSEPPVGIVTALLGCPFFVWLLKRRRRPIAV